MMLKAIYLEDLVFVKLPLEFRMRTLQQKPRKCVRKEIDEEIVEHEIDEIRENVKVTLEKARHKKYKTNLTKEKSSRKKKALQDNRKVFLPADKGRIMVAMDRYETDSGEQSYEYKMKQVLVDRKAKLSIRAKKAGT